ncbi:hypothetical protein ACWDTP_31280 [Mycobacterium sp. NPDC003449]
MRQRVMVAGLVVAAIGLAGCSNVTAGTPMADPDQTGITTTTTTRPPTRPTLPTAPPTASTPPPAGMAGTTCGAYLGMDQETKHQVIGAIGQDSELFSRNPELWVGMADMLCAFTPKEVLVRDVLMGQR